MLRLRSAGAPRHPRKSLRILVAAVIAACGAAAPADQTGPEECRSPNHTAHVVPIATFNNHSVFDQGGITAVDRGTIFAGLDTNDDGHITIVGVEGGELPAPRLEIGSASVDVPVPVALGDDRWGLLWVDAEPIGESPEWPSNLHTRLWFSEYVEGWTPPTEVLKALIVHWPGVRQVHPVPGRGAYTMVAAASLPQGRPELYFGQVDRPLTMLSFPSDLSPSVGGFVIDSMGEVIAVAEMVTLEGDRKLAAMLSRDWGVTWADPQVIARLGGRATEFRVHRDGRGILHVLRTQDWSASIRHLTFGPNLEPLGDRSIRPGVGAVMGWVSGFDRCDQLTVVISVVDSDQVGRMLIARFDGTSWTVPSTAFPGYHGAIPLDGISHDGRWWVAWSGGRLDTYPPPIHILKAQP